MALKFFRRYSRDQLQVFMSVLMVVFLIGDAIGRGIRRASAADVEIGEVYGHPVHLSDLRIVAEDARTAQRFGLPAPTVFAERDVLRSLGLYLLAEEARQAGIIVGEDHVRELLRAQQVPAVAVERECRRANRNINAFYRALGRLVAVNVLFRLQAEAALSESLPRLERAFRDAQEQARVLISVIPVDGLLDDVPDPTEEEMQAFFEQAHDRFTEHTDEELRFGYRQPDRIRLEYLTVDPQRIVEQVLISDKQARRFFEENQDRYWRALQEQAGDQGPVLPPTYEEVRDRVRAEYRLVKAISEARQLVSQMQGDALRPWENLKPGESPPADKIVAFRALRDRYSERYEVILRETGWVTREGFAGLPGLGAARYTVGQQAFPAVDLAFHVEGLVDAEAAADDDPLPLLRVNEPAPLVWTMRPDASGRPAPYQAFLFRVTQVQPSGPPESLDQVRQQVRADLRLVKAFERAGQLAEQLAAKAREVGLREAVEQAEDLRALLRDPAETVATTMPTTAATQRYLKMLQPYEPSQFGRQPTNLLNIGVAPRLHERVFEAAEQNPQPDKPLVLVVPLAGARRWAVVQVLGLKPLYEGEFQNQRRNLEQQEMTQAALTFFQAWCDIDNIRRRTHYIAKQPLVSEDEPNQDKAGTTP